jgi:uncharacterized protein (DUF1697 family)
MPTFVALLRGINMSGHKKLAMSDLCALAGELGLTGAKTLLQSGNLIFAAADKPDALEEVLEAAVAKRLGVTTRVLIRTAVQWKKNVAANPFVREADCDPSHLALMLLKHKPSPAGMKALRKAIIGREVIEADGHALYAYFPDGFGNTRLTTALIDRTLATTVTARSWNTVLRIAAAIEG